MAFFSRVALFKDSFLLSELIRKNIRSSYLNTVLGPIWLLAQPIITSMIFVFVFQWIIPIPTQGHSSFVFYSSGVVLWGYFAKSVSSLSNVFYSNRAIFSKFKFARLVVPISDVVANFVKFSLQFTVLIVVYMLFFGIGFRIVYPLSLLFFLIALLEATLFAIGIGLLSASLTTVFKDLGYLVGYGVQMLFYMTPIIYPVDRIPERFWDILQFNPMASAVDLFRFPFSDTLNIHGSLLLKGFCVAGLVCAIGITSFLIAEKNCTDRV